VAGPRPGISKMVSVETAKRKLLLSSCLFWEAVASRTILIGRIVAFSYTGFGPVPVDDIGVTGPYTVKKQRVNVPLQDFPSFLSGRDGFASKTTHRKDSYGLRFAVFACGRV
jgi:hypothetical protein